MVYRDFERRTWFTCQQSQVNYPIDAVMFIEY